MLYTCKLKPRKWKKITITYVFLSCILNSFCYAWLPDATSKLINRINQLDSVTFIGNSTHSNHFTILNQDSNSIIVGGRNTVYNLSLHDFSEHKNWKLIWASSDAHSQLCQLKGKLEDDCQNYIRILVTLKPGLILICGTNSYKPLCRHYSIVNGKYKLEKEIDGIGVCPYNPEYNNTAIESDGHIFTATVADFSERDPVIYREPQRTELSDLKQLNEPNFVSSMAYGDYIFFFFRETAVEYINCGKVIYSRVARVCRNDKGGPHQFGDRWTSFLKARLNCSVPGEYPFYFDEIQATSSIIEGAYGSADLQKVIYGTFTTPSNAIGGSAICAYRVLDIIKAFQSSFKHQENMNSNWLPIAKEKIPDPRPGECIRDSRVLPENVVNFVKTHSLMEGAVPSLFGGPILIRVSLQYRFTSIAVDAQVAALDGEKYDVLYVGTDNGKILKIVNIPTKETTTAVVISENNIFVSGTPVKQVKIAPGHGRVVALSQNELKLVTLVNCSFVTDCKSCVALQDPHCAWDWDADSCVLVDSVSTSRRSLIQDVRNSNLKKCLGSKYEKAKVENNIIREQKISDPLLKMSNDDLECEGETGNEIKGCAIKQQLVIYTAKTLQIVVVCSSIAALFLGFVAGYLFSRRYHHPLINYPDVPFIEQHNHLDRLNGNSNGFLTPRANKTINLVVNVPPSPSQKKDNLETKDLNIASDGTLQKIKKTYI